MIREEAETNKGQNVGGEAENKSYCGKKLWKVSTISLLRSQKRSQDNLEKPFAN